MDPYTSSKLNVSSTDILYILLPGSGFLMWRVFFLFYYSLCHISFLFKTVLLMHSCNSSKWMSFLTLDCNMLIHLPFLPLICWDGQKADSNFLKLFLFRISMNSLKCKHLNWINITSVKNANIFSYEPYIHKWIHSLIINYIYFTANQILDNILCQTL